MTQDQVVLAIVGALIVLSVGLAILVALQVRRARRSKPVAAVRAAPIAAADVEAFVAGVLPDPPGPARRPHALMVGGEDEEAVAAETGAVNVSRPGWASTRPERLAGLLDPATWSRAMREESARLARFGHPVTVVMAELPRLDALGASFGREMADRVAWETARLLVAEGRKADRIAWFPGGRFGMLLFETDEKTAGRYVQRVRAATDGWLESVGLSIRLSLGWASPAGGADVMAAATTAEQRMHDAGHGATLDTDTSAETWHDHRDHTSSQPPGATSQPAR